jgi:hypothetical protein
MALWQFTVVLSNLAYLAESPGLDFGEKNGKAAFGFLVQLDPVLKLRKPFRL